MAALREPQFVFFLPLFCYRMELHFNLPSFEDKGMQSCGPCKGRRALILGSTYMHGFDQGYETIANNDNNACMWAL